VGVRTSRCRAHDGAHGVKFTSLPVGFDTAADLVGRRMAGEGVAALGGS
jgi:hypothetical protein